MARPASCCCGLGESWTNKVTPPIEPRGSGTFARPDGGHRFEYAVAPHESMKQRRSQMEQDQ
ncbi:MAG TPA: hypothetical protein VL752_16700, partial [Acidisoma sp.]|uniref:hypothetical protein n=1 Tax=Acidisoma sp. TaxID=1872115 RepID=UPI002C09FD84